MPKVRGRDRAALQAVNFFMADMQAGIGPFLGVLLQGRGWATGAIGTVSTLGGIARMIATAPAGAFVDATTRKRGCVIVAGLFTVAASGLILLSRHFWVVAAAQAATAIAGAAIGTAVIAITLGVVRQAGFTAQAVMIAASLAAMRIAQTRGYWLAILIAFTALPIRGLIAAGVIATWGVVPVQTLDGVGAGMLSVAVAGLVARVLDGTGHINAGQGAVMTVQGLGAALSPAMGGFIAQTLRFRTAFVILGGLSLGSMIIWLGFASTLRRASDHLAAAPATADLE